MPATSLSRTEARFLDMRDAFDAAELAEARGLAAVRSRQLAAATLAELGATIRAERGDWVRGDAGWYEWVSERIYRWGLERSSGDVLRGVLGRRADPNALLTELARIGGAVDGSAL